MMSDIETCINSAYPLVQAWIVRAWLEDGASDAVQAEQLAAAGCAEEALDLCSLIDGPEQVHRRNLRDRASGIPPPHARREWARQGSSRCSGLVASALPRESTHAGARHFRVSFCPCCKTPELENPLQGSYPHDRFTAYESCVYDCCTAYGSVATATQRRCSTGAQQASCCWLKPVGWRFSVAAVGGLGLCRLTTHSCNRQGSLHVSIPE